MHEAPRNSSHEGREVAATIAYHGHPDAAATLRVRTWSKPERTGRAVRALLTCWGLAVLAVFLPVLHFVLVPSLLVAGPIAALARLREGASVLEANGACPACGVTQRFAVSGALREETRLRCESCGRAVSLRAPVTLPLD